MDVVGSLSNWLNEYVMGRVLVVDDELDICILVTKYLDNKGIKAGYALTIKEALYKTTLTKYDLYIVDLNLTDGSGYDLIHKLKELQSPAKIIMITAYDGEAKRALENGANYFLQKPLSKKMLDQALHTVNYA